MKKRIKLVIGLIIFIIILYILIVGYIAYHDEKNRVAKQNFCNIDFNYNVSKIVNQIDNNYDSSIDKLKNASFDK
jgi:hypothetical protein